MEEIKELTNGMPEFPIVGGELMVNTGIFEGEKIDDIELDIGNKKVPLKDILINKYGIPTTDGIVITLKNRFNKLFYKIHKGDGYRPKSY